MSAGVITSRSLAPSDLNGVSQSGAESLSRLRLSAEVRTKATLSVKTREGDTVTLSAGRAARADLTSMAYDRTGHPSGPDVSLQLAAKSLQKMQAFDAVVDGDLNEQERKDLDALLTNIDGVASAFFSGQIGEAITRALQVQDLGSLQSFRFDASYTASTYAEQESLVDHTGPPEADVPVFDTPTLAQAVEEFFTSFLRRREDAEPFSLKTLLSSRAPEVETAPTKGDVTSGIVSEGEGSGESSAPSVSQAGASVVKQSSGGSSGVSPFSPELDRETVLATRPESDIAEETEDKTDAGQESAESQADHSTKSENVPGSPHADPLAEFTQRIRDHVDASGLPSTRIGPYLPSFVTRLVEDRLSVVVSSLLP